MIDNQKELYEKIDGEYAEIHIDPLVDTKRSIARNQVLRILKRLHSSIRERCL